MAYKVFSNGDALTGAELNTYLMNQSVIQFASTTARDAAIPSPAEGQLVWLQDVNKYVYYTGSAWADLITPASNPNQVINGAFDIWQRGTSFSTFGFTADRWGYGWSGGTGITGTVSRQSFTPGTAPVSGYESEFFLRHNITNTGGATQVQIETKLEDVRLFAGQTATVSLWVKADAARTFALEIVQDFGTGGSTVVKTTGSTQTASTAWVRYTQTFSVPSISGKTIGTGSNLRVRISPDAAVYTFDIWGVQIEAGSTATAFKRNAPSIQAELAACQRYYYRPSGNIEATASVSGSSVTVLIPLPVTMRTTPTSGQNITDASYSTNPGANQWGLVQAQIGWSTKSGTASSIALVGTTSAAFLQIAGATFSPTPNAIKIVADRYLELSAEL